MRIAILIVLFFSTSAYSSPISKSDRVDMYEFFTEIAEKYVEEGSPTKSLILYNMLLSDSSFNPGLKSREVICGSFFGIHKIEDMHEYPGILSGCPLKMLLPKIKGSADLLWQRSGPVKCERKFPATKNAQQVDFKYQIGIDSYPDKIEIIGRTSFWYSLKVKRYFSSCKFLRANEVYEHIKGYEFKHRFSVVDH